MFHWLGNSLIQWACCIVISSPFVAMGIRSAHLRGREVGLGSLAQLALFFLISLSLAYLGFVKI
jgi:hypothetical protein